MIVKFHLQKYSTVGIYKLSRYTIFLLKISKKVLIRHTLNRCDTKTLHAKFTMLKVYDQKVMPPDNFLELETNGFLNCLDGITTKMFSAQLTATAGYNHVMSLVCGQYSYN